MADLALRIAIQIYEMHIRSMQNVSDLFSLWPTDAEMGRDIGVSYPTVAAWKRRGSIPAGYWRGLIAAAKARGFSDVTAGKLAELHDVTANTSDLSKMQNLPQQSALKESQGGGHFNRFRHLRRSRFASAEEIIDHVRALREEWDRR